MKEQLFKPVKNRKTQIAFTITAVLSGMFLLLNLLPVNLHCTQFTSLFSAAFDMEVHPEEIPDPLIYQAGYTFPLRTWFLSVLLVHIFIPVFVSYRFIRGKTGLMPAVLILFLAYAALQITNPFVYRLAGERFGYLYERSVLVSWTFYFTAIITIVLQLIFLRKTMSRDILL